MAEVRLPNIVVLAPSTPMFSQHSSISLSIGRVITKSRGYIYKGRIVEHALRNRSNLSNISANRYADAE
jgi:hypothetical protein